jgi:cysteine desulfurase
VNGLTGEDSAPHIVSVSFQGVRAEVLLHALEDKGIYVSSGSACSSNRPAVSRTLTAIHVEKEYLDETLRFSFSVHTTVEEIDYAIDTIKSILPILRKYTRH